MTEDTSTTSVIRPRHAGGARRDAAAVSSWSWIPTWGLIATKHLELRKRRTLMVVVVVLTVGLPVLVLGLRLVFHLADPKSYGPAGTPAVFQALCQPMAEFGFIIAATLGATAGTSDLTNGVFRQLVITGRSRLALYLARIPAGLSILLPLVAVAFAMVCLVTGYEGVSQPTSINEGGISYRCTWTRRSSDLASAASAASRSGVRPASRHRWLPVRRRGRLDLRPVRNDENTELNPADNEMIKIGLWLDRYCWCYIGQRIVPRVS